MTSFSKKLIARLSVPREALQKAGALFSALLDYSMEDLFKPDVIEAMKAHMPCYKEKVQTLTLREIASFSELSKMRNSSFKAEKKETKKRNPPAEDEIKKIAITLIPFMASGSRRVFSKVKEYLAGQGIAFDHKKWGALRRLFKTPLKHNGKTYKLQQFGSRPMSLWWYEILD